MREVKGASEHLTRDAINTTLSGRRGRVYSPPGSNAMKGASGLPQDLVDLEELGA
jgi:hypothetical protein